VGSPDRPFGWLDGTGEAQKMVIEPREGESRMSAPSEAGVSNPDNRDWLKVSHRARTDLCA
jgi:hypothetical protein